MYRFFLLCISLLCFNLLSAQTAKLRARAWGIPFEGTPAANNAITDVPGVYPLCPAAGKSAGDFEEVQPVEKVTVPSECSILFIISAGAIKPFNIHK